MMKKNNNIKLAQAFSLIELAAVILIIGLLIVGISKGLSLVKSSRINSARSITSKSAVHDTSGLIAWYETSMKESLELDEAIDETPIATWHSLDKDSLVDQVNSVSRTASSAVVYEAEGINDLGSVYFDGSGKLTISSLANGSFDNATIFLVFKPTAIGTPSIIFNDNGGNKAIGFDSDQIALESSGSFVYTSTTVNSASFSSGDNYIVTAYFNGSLSKAYQNNVDIVVGNGNITTAANDGTGISIGESSFTGLISEVIVFNRVLKLEERRDITRYLSKKYDIEVGGI